MTLKETLIDISNKRYKKIALMTALDKLSELSNVESDETKEVIENWQNYINNELKPVDIDEEIFNIEIPK